MFRALDEKAVGTSASLRQQMEKHRANAICASCHTKMDPLGFGLENYDGIGKWRTKDGKFPVDSSGTLPNGKSFYDPSEMRALLKSQLPEFARCMVEKMLIYSLGRGLERMTGAPWTKSAASGPIAAIRSSRSFTKSYRAFRSSRGGGKHHQQNTAKPKESADR